MKSLNILKLTALLILSAFAPHQVEAYDSHDYDKLLSTGHCVNCDLSFAELNNMDFGGSDLRGSDLTNVQFRGSNLFKAELFGATLLGTDFTYAIWVNGSTCLENSIGYCKLTSN